MGCEGACTHAHVRFVVARVRVRPKRVSTKMHTTLLCATRKILDKKTLSCAKRQVSWYIFKNEKSVVCHTTRLLCGTQHISQLIQVIMMLSICKLVNWAYVLNFRILTHLEDKNTCVVWILVYYCTRTFFLWDFQTFSISYDGSKN